MNDVAEWPKLTIPAAFKELFEAQHRYLVYYGGRGSTKSWSFARALIILGSQRKIRVLCTREFQGSIKDSVHKLLVNQIEQMGYGAHYRHTEKGIFGLTGTEFIFKGMRLNSQSIKSTEDLDIAWVEEADTTTADSWKDLIPTMRKKGSQIWVSFNTPTIHAATYKRFVLGSPVRAIVKKVSWRDNPYFSDEMREEMEMLKRDDYDDYLHVWEGELRRFSEGSIYAPQIRKMYKGGQITALPIELGVEVHTFWDLGRDDYTAIWFMQRVGKEHRFINYYQNRLQDIEHYAKILKDLGYLYGTHHMPHDISVQVLGMKTTRKTMFEESGIKPIQVVARIANIGEGIELTRKALLTSWIDPDRCSVGLEALANYKYDFNILRATNSAEPAKTWAAHGSDAFRQFAQSYRIGAYSAATGPQSTNSLSRHSRLKPTNDDSWRV